MVVISGSEEQQQFITIKFLHLGLKYLIVPTDMI